MTLGVSTLRANLWRNGIPVFTTTGNRDNAFVNPNQGDTCYVDDGTSAEGLYSYSGTAWRPVAWNSPWGQVGYAQATSNQTGITTEVDITSVTVPFTAVTNRIYRTTLNVTLLSTVGTDVCAVKIADGSNAQVQIALYPQSVANSVTSTAILRETISAGAVTRKGRITRAAGTGSISTQAAASSPIFILVEDIGPSGAPT